MSFSNVTILTKKLESLPEEVRERVAGYLSKHFEEIRDEIRWDEQFKKSSNKLAEMARQARKEIAEGKAEPMNFEKCRVLFRKFLYEKSFQKRRKNSIR